MRRQLEARYGDIGSLAKNGEFQSAVAEALEDQLMRLPELEEAQQSERKTRHDLQSIIASHQPDLDEDTADKLDLIALHFEPEENSIALQDLGVHAHFAASKLFNQRWHCIDATASSFAFADIQQSFFSDTNFTACDMEKSHWKETGFEVCDYSEADCVRAQFTDCHLSNCEFYNTNLSQAKFQRCEFNHVNFTGAQKWDQAKFRNCIFNECTVPKEMLEALQATGGNQVNDAILAFEATDRAPGESPGRTSHIADLTAERREDLLNKARERSDNELAEVSTPGAQVREAEIIDLQSRRRNKGLNE